MIAKKSKAHYRREMVEWLYLLIAVLALGTYIGYSQYHEYLKTESRQRALLTNHAVVIEKNLVAQLLSTSRVLGAILESIPIWRRENDDYQKANNYLKLLSDSLTDISTLLLINADGCVLASNRGELIGQNLRERAYFQNASKSPRSQALFITPTFRTSLNSWDMSLYRIIPGPNGEFAGIVIASLNPSYFHTLLDSVRDMTGMHSFVAHRDGKLFLMAPDLPEATGEDLAQASGIFSLHVSSGKINSLLMGRFFTNDESNSLIALRTIQPKQLNMDRPLVVGVFRDLAALYADWQHALFEQAWIFAILCLTTMLSLFFYQQRRRVLIRLVNSKEQALHSSDARLNSFFNATPDALLISDMHGTITLANQQVEHLLGYRVEELMGKSIDELVPNRFKKNHLAQRTEFAEAPSARRMGTGLTVKARRKDGSECDVEVSLSRIESDEGIFFASALRDITERNRSEEQLRIAAVAFESHQGVVVIDSDDVILRVNAAFTKLTGYSADEVIGRTLSLLRSDRHDADFWGAIWEQILRDGCWEGEVWNRTKCGDVRPYWLTIASVANNLGVITHYILTYTDITESLQNKSKLMASELRLRTIFENEPDCIKIVDAEGRLVQINPAGLAMIEADSVEQVVGKRVIDLVAPEYQAAFTDLQRRVIAGESVRLKFRLLGLKGGQRWLDTHAVPLLDNGQPTQLAVTRDVTASQKVDADLRIAAAAFESQYGLVVTDAQSVILRVNQAFTTITGYESQELIGQKPSLLKSDRHGKEFYRLMWEVIHRTGHWEGEIWDRRKNGEIYPKWLTISAVKDVDGAVSHYIGAHQDISDRKKVEEKIKTLAFFDQLTGLPNRTLLQDRLKQAMTTSSRCGTYGALLFIDLDHFKTLNDTLGHDMGDLLLKQVAQRLLHSVRDGDTVARLGGDEFVVVLSNLSKNQVDAASGTEIAAEKILTTLNQIYQVGSLAHRSTASIGVTLFLGQTVSMDDLMKQADLAMYRAKEVGRNTLRFFDPDMQAAVLNRVALEKDLREAIKEDQFSLHYQALVSDSGRVTGAEVLIRWNHPVRGMVYPADFIPLAEESGAILPLGHWVLETACRQLAIWSIQTEMAHLTVAVNVSAHQFNQTDFVEQVLTVVNSTGANPQRLKLELTESFLVSNVEATIAKMMLLKAQGISFALDDFGTGYSSLAYLKRLPLDQLKIDRSFVRDVLTDQNDAAIAKTIVALAESLGLGVIAEGVETQEQWLFLASSGCHDFQGYFFSRPLPVEDFEAYTRCG